MNEIAGHGSVNKGGFHMLTTAIVGSLAVITVQAYRNMKSVPATFIAIANGTIAVAMTLS